MRIRIAGKQWDLKFYPSLGRDSQGTEYLGLCDNPELPNPRIKIKKGQKDKAEMSVICHEIGHASAYPLLSEEFCDQMGDDIAEVLYKLGYRKLSKEELKIRDN
jgi:hypothetical protein